MGNESRTMHCVQSDGRFVPLAEAGDELFFVNQVVHHGTFQSGSDGLQPVGSTTTAPMREMLVRYMGTGMPRCGHNDNEDFVAPADVGGRMSSEPVCVGLFVETGVQKQSGLGVNAKQVMTFNPVGTYRVFDAPAAL